MFPKAESFRRSLRRDPLGSGRSLLRYSCSGMRNPLVHARVMRQLSRHTLWAFLQRRHLMPGSATASPRELCSGITTVLLLLSVHAPLLVAQGSVASSTPEDSVRAVELARRQALLQGDTVALSRLVAEDFIEISRLGTVRTKADNMRDIASGNLKLTSVRYDSLTVRIYGDVAVLQGIAENAGTLRGLPFSGKIRYTRVFVRRSGRWQAVAMQQTSMQ